MEMQKGQEMSDAAMARRDFLRKSVYAACATPVIMSLLVEKADAAQSWNPGIGRRPNDNAGGPGNANMGDKGGPENDRWEFGPPGKN